MPKDTGSLEAVERLAELPTGSVVSLPGVEGVIMKRPGPRYYIRKSGVMVRSVQRARVGGGSDEAPRA